MFERVSQGQSANQSIMTTILKHLPSETGVTKIEYEGPYIGLHTKTPRFLLEHQDLISQLVNSIKKRIVIRTDSSIRSSEKATRHILNSMCLSKDDISDVFFDPALGEATIFVKDLSALSILSQNDIDLTEKTGWRMIFRRQPRNIKIYKSINDILSNRSAERILFYKQTGEKIFRPKLSGTTEANIVCLGGFNEIGRSSLLLITHESKVLLDFGMKVGQDDNLNSLPRLDTTGLSTEDIDGVIISHGHFGHSGALPLLFKYGYQGPVYCTEPTLPLMISLQRNYLQARKNNSMYSKNEIDEVILHTIPVNLGSVTDISPDVRLMLTNAGHILGSSSMHLHIGNGDHNLVYSSDFKFGKTIALDNSVWNFPRVETMVIESTHGSREDIFPLREDVENCLINSINSCLESGGRVLIPVPTLGISQELCITLGMLTSIGRIKPEKIFVEESILDLLDFYEIYSEYLSRNLKLRISAGEKDPLFTDALVPLDRRQDSWDRCIVLAPSADLTDGKSTLLLKEICADTSSKLIIVTNSMSFTPSFNIAAGERSLLLGRRKIQLDCSVDVIRGFTDHSDYNQLLAYVSRLKPKLRRVITNHGSGNKCHALATNLNKIFKISTQHPSVHESIKLL
jgi:predicted metal-dependent RNase